MEEKIKGDAVDMMNYLKENSVNKFAFEKLPEEERRNKILVGELYKGQRPEYIEEYNKIIESF